MNHAANIKRVRFLLGKNQVQFGKLLNTTQSCVSLWEKGKTFMPPKKANILVEYANRKGISLELKEIRPYP